MTHVSTLSVLGFKTLVSSVFITLFHKVITDVEISFPSGNKMGFKWGTDGIPTVTRDIDGEPVDIWMRIVRECPDDPRIRNACYGLVMALKTTYSSLDPSAERNVLNVTDIDP
jgi:hypothetical protein